MKNNTQTRFGLCRCVLSNPFFLFVVCSVALTGCASSNEKGLAQTDSSVNAKKVQSCGMPYMMAIISMKGVQANLQKDVILAQYASEILADSNATDNARSDAKRILTDVMSNLQKLEPELDQIVLPDF